MNNINIFTIQDLTPFLFLRETEEKRKEERVKGRDQGSPINRDLRFATTGKDRGSGLARLCFVAGLGANTAFAWIKKSDLFFLRLMISGTL